MVTVESRFKNDLILQIYLPTTLHIFSAPIFFDLLNKYFLNQTLFDLRKTNRGFLNRDLPVPLFSSIYHIKRPFFRLKIARFFSRWHGWDREEWCGYLYFWHVVLIIVVWYEMRQSRLIVKLRLFKTCFIVTFWGVLLQVFTGPQCVFNFFSPTSYLRWWPRLLVPVHSWQWGELFSVAIFSFFIQMRFHEIFLNYSY